MSFLRTFIVWLVMAALPLSGAVAAAMPACGSGAHAAALQQEAPGVPAQAHDEGHDHAAHSHDGDAVTTHATGADDHACAACAACCNLVALAGWPVVRAGAHPPSTQPWHGPASMPTRALQAPDKPPRA